MVFVNVTKTKETCKPVVIAPKHKAVLLEFEVWIQGMIDLD